MGVCDIFLPAIITPEGMEFFNNNTTIVSLSR
jgi:hypothetical protein